MRIVYERSMYDYVHEIGRDDVRETLQTIIDEGKIDEFEQLIEDEIGTPIDDEELYDFLRDEWEYIFERLGITDGIDYDDD